MNLGQVYIGILFTIKTTFLETKTLFEIKGWNILYVLAYA